MRCTFCRNCGHIDCTNREGEKFICSACGFFAHADITAS
ncbi:zinc ribbon domain-containing protein [Microseira sp. BLCC-F43]